MILSPTNKVNYVSGSNALTLFQEIQEDTTIYAGLVIPSIMYIEGMGMTKITSIENYLKSVGLEDVISTIERITKEEFNDLINSYVSKIDTII